MCRSASIHGLNPYYPKYNENGGIDKWLEYLDKGTGSISVPNPLWNASLNSYDKGNTFKVRDNFQMEYRPWTFLYVRANFGITKATSDDENFFSPEDTRFDNSTDDQKGSYTGYSQRESLVRGEFHGDLRASDRGRASG